MAVRPAALPLWARLVPTALAVTHLAVLGAIGGLRPEHVAGNLLLGVFPWLGPRFGRFALLAIPVWGAGVLIDAQRYWLHLRGPVHTGDLFLLERSLFPFAGVSFSEWLSAQVSAPMDLLCGLAYATYILEVLVAAVILYTARSPRVVVLACAFFVMNLIGAVVYMLYPAAPPWYVAQHGLGPADPHAVASAAGAVRFDALIGYPWFQKFYSRNPNVFGAMPSLHVAYPVVVMLVGWERGRTWRVLTVAYAALMSVAAVYLAHHYILDVLAGWTVAVVAVASVAWVVARVTPAARAQAVVPIAG